MLHPQPKQKGPDAHRYLGFRQTDPVGERLPGLCWRKLDDCMHDVAWFAKLRCMQNSTSMPAS